MMLYSLTEIKKYYILLKGNKLITYNQLPEYSYL